MSLIGFRYPYDERHEVMKTFLSFKWGRSNKDTNRATGKVENFLSDNKIQIGQDWYMDIRMDEPQLVGKEITRDLRIEFPHPADDRENIGKNMSNIIQKGIESCSEIDGIFNYENSGNSKHYYFLLDGCSGDDDENVKILGNATNANFNHLTWTRFEKVRRKVPFFRQRFGEETEICTTEISAGAYLATYFLVIFDVLISNKSSMEVHFKMMEHAKVDVRRRHRKERRYQ